MQINPHETKTYESKITKPSACKKLECDAVWRNHIA